MGNELIPAYEAQSNVCKYEDLTSSATYLPRLQLMTSNSKVCKGGEFPVNHFALIADQDHQDLGTSVDIVVCAFRGKALDTSSDKVVESLNPDSDLFKDISARANTKDSGCMFGPEYLVWIPEVSKFATIFYGSKSARRESKSIHILLRKGATLKAKKIETAEYTWFLCAADECSSISNLPDPEIMMEQINLFLNPPAKAEPTKDDGAETDRPQ